MSEHPPTPPTDVSTEPADVAASPEYEAICAREDLAHIGAIQALGFVVVVHQRNEVLVQVSANAAQHLSGRAELTTPQSLLGLSATSVLGAVWPAAVRLTARQADPVLIPVNNAPLLLDQQWVCRGHRCGSYVVLEFLPNGTHDSRPLIPDLRGAVEQLSDAESVLALVDRSVDALQALTGFDRVMLYHFLPDWCGEVLAEATRPGVAQRYRGQRFPAGDIPAQARALYEQMGVRLIADTTLGSEPMVPTMPVGDSRPLDMSRCLLRAVSAAHVDYLSNMEVRQSMSIALHCDDRLWGLIACHQGAAQPIEFASFARVVSAAEHLGALVESKLSELRDRQDREFSDAVTASIHRTLSSARALGYQNDLLFDLLNEFRWNQNYCCLGVLLDDWSFVVQSDEQVEHDPRIGRAIAAMCRKSATMTRQGLVASRDITADFNAEDDITAEQLSGAAGLLAYQPTEYARLTVFAGLPPEASTITWAGNPDVVRKQVVDGRVVISPRTSFAKWQTEERHKSRFWGDADRRLLFKVSDAMRLWDMGRRRQHA